MGELRVWAAKDLPDHRFVAIDRLRKDVVELVMDVVHGVHHRLTNSKR